MVTALRVHSGTLTCPVEQYVAAFLKTSAMAAGVTDDVLEAGRGCGASGGRRRIAWTK